MDQDLHKSFQSTDDFLATYDLNYDDKETPSVPFIGLKNLGNTCFFNSVVQILYYCPGFRKELCTAVEKVETFLAEKDLNLLISEKEIKCIFSVEEAKCRCDLLLELKQIFDSMDGNQMLMLDKKETDDCTSFRAVKPGNLMKYLRDVNPVFEPYTQQDAQECLQSILSILRDALSLDSKKSIGEGYGNIVVDVNDTKKGCKLFGGRKLDPSKQETSSENRVQIENRDPNRFRGKKMTHRDVKKELKFAVGKPLKDKIPQAILNETKHSSKSFSSELQDNDLKKIRNSQSSPDSQESSGCFPKLRRKRKPEIVSKELDGQVPWSTAVSTPAVSLSPPFKRKRFETLSIKVPSKPAITKNGKRKAADKNRLFSGFKTGKHKNPFKIIPKLNPCALTDYSLLDGNSTRKAKAQDEAKLEHEISNSSRKTDNRPLQLKKAKKYSDFIEQLFQGQLVNKIKCMECENSQRKTESFMEISLPVKGVDTDAETTTTTECSTELPSIQKRQDHCSVLWGLTEFTCREILDGTNKYHCDDCKRYVEGEKSVQFSSLPPILTLHLKRFTASKTLAGGDMYNTTTVSKINTSLDVPLKLSLRDWCESICEERYFGYTLFGIVVHSGVTISSGHYLSYIRLTKSSCQGKNLCKAQIDKLSVYWGSWLEADDERTRILSEEEVLKLLTHNETEGISRTPYLLFYERDNQT